MERTPSMFFNRQETLLVSLALFSSLGLWVEVCRGLTMVQEKNNGINKDVVLPPIQQNKPALSWELKIKKVPKILPPCLGKFRPIVGQCCHQCTPDSLRKSLGQKSFLGFHNLLSVKETHTRYRGWLVRRVCCVLFVSGCKVYASPVCNRLERVCQSNRVKEALTAEQEAPEEGDSRGQINRLSPFLPLINTCISPGLLRFVGWMMLKTFASVFGVIEVNLNHLSALHRASQELVRELLHEGQAISVGVSAESGRGGQWLARIRQLIKEGSVPDVSLVPVGISYDCLPKTNKQVGLSSVLQWLWSVLWRRPQGSVQIHFAQPFSLKEICESGRCRVDEWLPLQDLLLPVILNNRAGCVYGRRSMSWLLPHSHHASELNEPTPPERDLSIAIILHLIFSTTSCMAVMSTSLVSSLLLYRHRKGVRASVLCRDVVWLTEELLFRNKDVGFGGNLVEIVHYSLYLLAPHLIIAAAPSRKDPLIVPHPSLGATLHLTLQAQIVRHTFILEAVGACAVSAMLCEVARSGVSSRVRSDGVDGEEVKGDMEFDVALCQSELTERALQLCHLLPPGFMPPCQPSQSFALDAVDSLVRCGILIMEEIPRDVPICDFWKRECTLTWTTSDEPYHSDSDCEEQELRSYKISQPNQCPEMLFFLCSMLAGHLRSLCWATAGLDLLHTPLPEAEFVAQIHSHLCETANKKKQHYESCSEEAARTAVRTLIDLGVLSEERQKGGIFLGVSTLFQVSENRQKLHRFISQYLFN
ncbi:glycerol-3-phosphate acyltransferase 2, mitochondrial isoform X5 [Micropterus dolomieu]|uniref:glycerol-3-phosphate acyltransferase 2, mitochondrial isoform X5 n=1 Tax=Micropterus dolomieu TaxID=147949 RepID=UPI001E8D7DC6|nr:glycerol-3-phosphate acyltransferase 2, mitochondrial isoform X5 [Micropterus dolomieu]